MSGHETERSHGDERDAEDARDEAAGAKAMPQALQAPVGMANHPMGESTTGIAFVGFDDRILHVNREIVRFFGRPESELVRRSWQGLGHPDEAQENAALAGRLVAGRQDRYRLPRRFVHADGSTLYADLSASVIRDPDGTPQMFVAEVIDRTPESRALVDFAAATAQYRLLLEHTADMIVRTTPDGHIEWVSPSSLEILGYRPDELLGRSGAEFFHPDDVAQRLNAIERVAAGQPARVESRLRTADGEWRWMLGDSHPIADDQGETVGIVSSWRPIDEEVAGREALRATEALVRSIIDASPDTIAVTDAEGRIRFVTPNVAEVFRLPTADNPIRRRFDEFVVAEDRERAVASVHEVAVGNSGGASPYTCLRGDGTTFDAEVTGRAIRAADGTPTGFVLVLRDVTSRKEAERMLRESEDHLTEARRLEALGRLAGGVAHDFNNILMAINGTAEILAESLEPSDPRYADAVAIQAAGSRAAALTAQLLAFGRRQVLRPTVVDIGAVLTDLAPMLRRTMGSDVALRMDVAPGGVAVRADRSQLEQVLINLVFNARDAMPLGGVVTVTADDDWVDAPPSDSPMAGQPGRCARLSVTDTGTGIDETILPRVFEPFFTTKAQGRGTGLGLATVAGIVGQSGGWVEVATALGQGSTFTIYLPLANPQPSEAPLEDATLRRSAPTQERTGPAPVVLVVDDDPVVRTACSRLLLGLGYGVLEQHSPEAALALSDEALRRVSVILTDIVMPGMDGTSMAHRLRERLPELPVLFMSGHTPDPRAHDHLAEPGVAFLAKPFTRGALDAAIRQLLEA